MFVLSSTVPEMRVLFRYVIIHVSSIPVLVVTCEGDIIPLMAGKGLDIVTLEVNLLMPCLSR